MSGRGREKYNNAVDANQDEIVSGLREAGASVCIIARPVDLLVGYQGIWYLLEVKLPYGPKGGDPSTRTRAQREFYKQSRADVWEVRSLAAALHAIGAQQAPAHLRPENVSHRRSSKA